MSREVQISFNLQTKSSPTLHFHLWNSSEYIPFSPLPLPSPWFRPLLSLTSLSGSLFSQTLLLSLGHQPQAHLLYFLKYKILYYSSIVKFINGLLTPPAHSVFYLKPNFLACNITTLQYLGYAYLSSFILCTVQKYCYPSDTEILCLLHSTHDFMYCFALAVSSFCPLINLQDWTQRLSILWSLSSWNFDILVTSNLLKNLSQDFVYKYL